MFHPLNLLIKIAPLGTRRIAIGNFTDLCTQLGIEQRYVKKMIETGLGTTSDFATTMPDTLIIKGRFNASNIRQALGLIPEDKIEVRDSD